MHLLPIYNPLQPDCASLDEGKYALSSCLVGCLFVMHKQLFPVQQQLQALACLASNMAWL